MATAYERSGIIRVGQQGTNERNEEGKRTRATLLDLLIRELHLVPVEPTLCRPELCSDTYDVGSENRPISFSM